MATKTKAAKAAGPKGPARLPERRMDDPKVKSATRRGNVRLPLCILDLPADTNDCWPWIVDLYAYDHGDTQPLAARIARGESIPVQLAQPVSAIIAGTRRPNRKSSSKSKLGPKARIQAAAELSAFLGLMDQLRHFAIVDPNDPARGAEAYANASGKETIEIVREYERNKRRAIEGAAKSHGVSVETIENWLRELRALIDRLTRV